MIDPQEWTAIGIDEAGRGCMAGPVVAAACLLMPGFEVPFLDDSKKMTEKRREKAFDLLEAGNGSGCFFAVGMGSAAEIDKVNILEATFNAMHRAVMALSSSVDMSGAMLYVDGDRFRRFEGVPHRTVIGGDATYRCIAAASVVAKVTRDRIMRELHGAHPEYGWDRSKGYVTKAHLQALSDHGYTEHHRRSYSVRLPAKSLL